MRASTGTRVGECLASPLFCLSMRGGSSPMHCNQATFHADARSALDLCDKACMSSQRQISFPCSYLALRYLVASSPKMPPPRMTVTLMRPFTHDHGESTHPTGTVTTDTKVASRISKTARTFGTAFASSTTPTDADPRPIPTTDSAARASKSSGETRTSKIYGIVPGSPTTRIRPASTSGIHFTYAPSTTFNTPSTPLGPSTFVTSVLATKTSITPTSISSTTLHAQPQDFLPDPPPYAIHLLAAGIAAAFLLAILLYFVNFPPAPSVSIARHAGRTSPRPSDIDTGAITTGADTPALTARTRRRRNAKNLSVDVGLGIEGCDFRRQTSYDDGLANKELDGGRRDEMWQALTAPLPAVERFFASPRTPGLFEDTKALDTTGYPKSPRALVDEHDKASVTGKFLARVGNGIEYVADKIGRALHQQVKSDAEGGLLLPFRDEDRRRRHEEQP